jgi:hypothetical protein
MSSGSSYVGMGDILNSSFDIYTHGTRASEKTQKERLKLH